MKEPGEHNGFQKHGHVPVVETESLTFHPLPNTFQSIKSFPEIKLSFSASCVSVLNIHPVLTKLFSLVTGNVVVAV